MVFRHPVIWTPNLTRLVLQTHSVSCLLASSSSWTLTPYTTLPATKQAALKWWVANWSTATKAHSTYPPRFPQCWLSTRITTLQLQQAEARPQEQLLLLLQVHLKILPNQLKRDNPIYRTINSFLSCHVSVFVSGLFLQFRMTEQRIWTFINPIFQYGWKTMHSTRVFFTFTFFQNRKKLDNLLRNVILLVKFPENDFWKKIWNSL